MTSISIRIVDDDDSPVVSSSVEASPTVSDKSSVRFVCDPDEIEQGEEETQDYERITRFSFKTTQIDSYEKLEAKLNRNYCAATLIILNEVNINGRIYVHKNCLKSPENKVEEEKKKRKLLHEKLKNLIPLKSKKRDESSENTDYHTVHVKKMVKPFGEAHLLWSRNKWQNWQTVKAHYVKQANKYLIYEANLMDLHNVVENGEKIEFVACYQNDFGLFKETNDDKCFVLERTDLIFPVMNR